MRDIAAAQGFGLALPSSDKSQAQTPAVTFSAELAELVRVNSPLLFRVAYSILRSPAEAEDVVQDTFLRVLQKQTRLAEISDPRIWLTRIAWNLALDRRRRIRPDQMNERFAQELAANATPADQTLTDSARITTVLAEIDRLPRREREIILLAASEDLTSAELAAVMQCSESAARALLFRARTRLRARLHRREADRGEKRPTSIRRSAP